jgi:hypothetical protein
MRQISGRRETFNGQIRRKCMDAPNLFGDARHPFVECAKLTFCATLESACATSICWRCADLTFVGKSTVHRSGPTPLTAQMYSDRLVYCRTYPLASLYLTLSAPIIHLDSAKNKESVIISPSRHTCSTRHVGISGHQSCRDASVTLYVGMSDR